MMWKTILKFAAQGAVQLVESHPELIAQLVQAIAASSAKK